MCYTTDTQPLTCVPKETVVEKTRVRFCNRAYAPGEKMYVCRPICDKKSEQSFLCCLVPNCPPCCGCYL